MLYLLLGSLAFPADTPAPSDLGGRLVVQTKLPAEVLVDGAKLAQIWAPATVMFDIEAGPHELRVYTQGEPTNLPIVLKAGKELSVVVGRTGITLEESAVASAPADAATVPVEFRCVGAPLQIRLDRERLQLAEGDKVSVDLAPGRHEMSVRNAAGTVMWATGTLEVQPRRGLVVQVSDGRMPELFGPGRFHARGGG